MLVVVVVRVCCEVLRTVQQPSGNSLAVYYVACPEYTTWKRITFVPPYGYDQALHRMLSSESIILE